MANGVNAVVVDRTSHPRDHGCTTYTAASRLRAKCADRVTCDGHHDPKVRLGCVCWEGGKGCVGGGVFVWHLEMREGREGRVRVFSEQGGREGIKGKRLHEGGV